MERIIKIDEALYNRVKEKIVALSDIPVLCKAVDDSTPYNPTGDCISREALKEHKFLTPQVKVIGGRHNGKTQEQVIQAYQKGWNDCIDAIIDNAPTVPLPNDKEEGGVE